jgi:hypothetical protein
MNDKDKESFEKWLNENRSSLVKYGALKKMDDDFHLCWQAACESMRNRSPLDPVSLYDKLEKERERSSDFLVKKKAVVRYCYDHLDKMWAANITGILLGCDFRDAKERADQFFKYCEEEGI